MATALPEVAPVTTPAPRGSALLTTSRVPLTFRIYGGLVMFNAACHVLTALALFLFTPFASREILIPVLLLLFAAPIYFLGRSVWTGSRGAIALLCLLAALALTIAASTILVAAIVKDPMGREIRATLGMLIFSVPLFVATFRHWDNL